MKKNATLTAEARQILKGKWSIAVLCTLIFYFIFYFIGFSLGLNLFYLIYLIYLIPLICFLIIGPLTVGYITFCMALKKEGDASVALLFDGFKRFGRSFAGYFFYIVFTFLWSLLLIIPGIIAAIAYSQTLFILADDDSIGAYDAVMKSQKMMHGYKWKYFGLYLRFLGWSLLAILTLGIGFFWLMPYMQMSYLNFYQERKAEYEASLPGQELGVEVPIEE